VHCYICDAELKETEIVFNKQEKTSLEPCRKCLYEIHNIKYPPLVKVPSSEETLEEIPLGATN